MEQAITMALYLKLTGITVAAGAIVVGFWISEIRKISSEVTAAKKAIDDHKSEDEKEFYEAQRSNDSIHADLRREMGQVKGSAELAVAGLKGDLNTMSGTLNGKLDTLISLFKEQVAK